MVPAGSSKAGGFCSPQPEVPQNAMFQNVYEPTMFCYTQALQLDQVDTEPQNNYELYTMYLRK